MSRNGTKKQRNGHRAKTDPDAKESSNDSSLTPKIIGILALLCYCLSYNDSGGASSSRSMNENDNPPSQAPKKQPTSFVDYTNTNFESGTSSFDNYNDPNMKELKVSIDGESLPRYFQAYVTPDVSTFYNDQSDDNSIVSQPRFVGLAAKFINMSPETLALYWEGNNEGPMLIGILKPFEAFLTATFPSHQFVLAPNGKPREERFRATILPHQSLYIYDPYMNTSTDLDKLNAKQKRKYQVQHLNTAFAKQYKSFTGRDWLALYPNRRQPRHKMWNADYFGQQHSVATAETHFIQQPPSYNLNEVSGNMFFRELSDTDPRRLHEYRSSKPTLNMTMTVLSCAPRVFEIQNFLSPTEVNHLLAHAKAHESASAKGSKIGNRSSWIPRHTSIIVDSVYRRAADLMRIDEALLRERKDYQRPDFKTNKSLAESIQFVHYTADQQFIPHHDFAHPRQSAVGQPVRFGTLLVYLNDDMTGGETYFPRSQSDNGEPLLIKPEIGKAVLFYSMLPDGNMDDLSQHASLPVKDGEKWLMNLWVWDPDIGNLPDN